MRHFRTGNVPHRSFNKNIAQKPLNQGVLREDESNQQLCIKLKEHRFQVGLKDIPALPTTGSQVYRKIQNAC